MVINNGITEQNLKIVFFFPPSEDSLPTTPKHDFCKSTGARRYHKKNKGRKKWWVIHMIEERQRIYSSSTTFFLFVKSSVCQIHLKIT